jgi:hypothetical protein
MTLVSPSTTLPIADAAPQVAPIPRVRWYAYAFVAVAVFGIFFALLNPFWLRGGDGDVYLCLARSLVRGEGYRFNGQPVAMVPIGWPIVLAAAMKISSSFSFLKFLLIGLMSFGLFMWFCALRRLTSPLIAACAVVITALLQSTFQLTYWFHAEAMFIALTGAAMVVAFQINEGRREVWRIVLLALLCAASLTARWAGMLFFPMVAAALLDRQIRPKLDRVMLAAVTSALAVALVFCIQRIALRVDPASINPRFDASMSGGYDLMNEPTDGDSLSDRLINVDVWFGRMYWSPLIGPPQYQPAMRVVGITTAVLTIAMVILGAAMRRWVWLGLAVYCGALAVNWPHAVGRYFVPVAPLLVAAMMHVIAKAMDVVATGPCKTGLAFCINAVLIGAILAPNIDAYIDDIRVLRSAEFPTRYRGGTENSLIAAAQVLREKGLDHGELIVSRRGATHYMENFTNGWMRAAHLLTDRAVCTISDSMTRDPDYTTFEWISNNGGQWYVYQPRVYVEGHDRLTSFRGKPVTLEQMHWQLYRIVEGRATRMELPANPEWPRSMPGLESE